MKHIFTIHSPITFLMAIAVIKTNNLKDDEILIFTSGYDPIINLPYVKKSFDSIKRSLIEKIRYWNTPKESDKYINSFLEKNENFVAYIDLMHMHQRILITNKNCINFSFIEEGTASYLLPNTVENVGYLFKNNKDRFNKMSDLVRDFRFLLRGYTMKIISMSFTPQSYNDIAVKYYCLSDAAYPIINPKKREIINLKQLEFNDILNDIPVLKNDIIWIEESFTYAYNMLEIEYEMAIEKTINLLKKKLKDRTIYLKKRPNQKTEKSLVFKTLLKNGFKVIILDHKIILELVLRTSQNCILVGNVSSLLFYGDLFGHKSYSMFNLLQNKPPTAFENFDFYWKKVKKL